MRALDQIRLLTNNFDDTFTITLNVMCDDSDIAASKENLVIDQPMVERARANQKEEVITIAPGPLKLLHDRATANETALLRPLTFVRGTVSEGDNSFELCAKEMNRLRDGGTTLFQLEFKHPDPKRNKYYPVKLTPGNKITTFELTYHTTDEWHGTRI